MKIIAQIEGGSHLYGLETPTSDSDIRYVFLYEDIGKIIGLDKNSFIDHRNSVDDEFGYEFRYFLNSLRLTNTQALELLYAPTDRFQILEPEFVALRRYRNSLINPHKYHQSLMGYIDNEYRLAFGERTGKLGSKRKQALDQYGFSPKNVVQLLRLSRCGEEFFKTGDFPTHLPSFDPTLTAELLDIKMHPEKYTATQLQDRVYDVKVVVDEAFRTSTVKEHFQFDTRIANQLIANVYLPILTNADSIVLQGASSLGENPSC